MQWLGRQPYSVAKLRGRLERAGAEPEAVEECLARLSGWGYLDDRKFAAGRIAVLKGRLKSRAYVEYDLLNQGLAPATVAEILTAEYPWEEELAVLGRLLKRKSGQPGDPAKEYQRLIRAGFDEEAVRRYLPEPSPPLT